MKRNEFLADMDNDDDGLSHMFQVLKNYFTGSRIHHYSIQEILVKHQNLQGTGLT
jgi:hypothetical protein